MAAYTIYIDGICYSAILYIPKGHNQWSLQHFQPKPRTPDDIPNIDKLHRYLNAGGEIGYDSAGDIITLSLCDLHGAYHLSSFTWPTQKSSGHYKLNLSGVIALPTAGDYHVYPSTE